MEETQGKTKRVCGFLIPIYFWGQFLLSFLVKFTLSSKTYITKRQEKNNTENTSKWYMIINIHTLQYIKKFRQTSVLFLLKQTLLTTLNVHE